MTVKFDRLPFDLDRNQSNAEQCDHRTGRVAGSYAILNLKMELHHCEWGCRAWYLEVQKNGMTEAVYDVTQFADLETAVSAYSGIVSKSAALAHFLQCRVETQAEIIRQQDEIIYSISNGEGVDKLS